MSKTQVLQARICYGCGSNKTYETKDGIQQWYANHDESKNYLCINCDRNYIRLTWLNTKNRTFRFAGRKLTSKKIVRTGVCSKCSRTIESGDIKQTQLHHLKYDVKDPLAHTIELCASCHVKESYRLGQSKGGGHKKEVGGSLN